MKLHLNPKLGSIALLILGILLVIWGVSGTFGAFISGELFQEEVVDEGFIPYVVPLEEDAALGDPLLQGPPDQTLEPEEEGDAESDSEIGFIDPDELVDKEFITAVPDGISIPAIDLTAPVVEALSKKTWMEAKQYEQLLAPDEYAAGWYSNSAKLGEAGNTVLSGHHNVYGRVFMDLHKLEIGDEIIVYGEGNKFEYVIANKMIFQERDVSAERRLDNARWIMPSMDERLTLVTCWPYETNTHRLIIVARPKQ